MKKAILMIFALGLGISISAQAPLKQGEVTYLETAKIQIRMEGMTEEMMNRLPKERKDKKILYFNENSSCYQNSKENADAPVPGDASGGLRIMVGNGADNIVYLDFENNTKIEQRDFMTRTFLITGDIEKENWKLTGNQKQILDYPCQEATRMTDKDTISAWFTPAIPVNAGPSNYVNLPGLVLEVDINNGKRVITAEKVDLKPIDKKLISKPSKGKKVSKEEYQKIVDEKMEEMKSSNGGTVIMRIKND